MGRWTIVGRAATGRSAAGARCAPAPALRAKASSATATGPVRRTLRAGGRDRRSDLVPIGRRRAGARDGACRDERAESGGLDHGVLVVEWRAAQAPSPPPGQE